MRREPIDYAITCGHSLPHTPVRINGEVGVVVCCSRCIRAIRAWDAQHELPYVKVLGPSARPMIWSGHNYDVAGRWPKGSNIRPEDAR